MNIELQSTLRKTGEVELRLVEQELAEPARDEIVVKLLATPFHPADMSLMFARADVATAKTVVCGDRSITKLQCSEGAAQAQSARRDLPMAVGMEGAGEVVAAGSDHAAQALIGRVVAIMGGGMYARYRIVRAADALVMPDGVVPSEAAAAHINPLTALGMIETMRIEGFSGLVHTAASSTVGQILCRLCDESKIPLVNIVRRSEQVDLLRSIGAEHVCDTSDPGFEDGLLRALQQTGATLAFDATGGGDLASRILALMERANAPQGGYHHYGSAVRKKVMIYGTLDPSPLMLLKNYGLAWEIGGYLVYHFMDRIGTEGVDRLKDKIAAGIKTTFAVNYSRTISLADACDPATLNEAGRRATGEKFLIDPSL